MNCGQVGRNRFSALCSHVLRGLWDPVERERERDREREIERESKREIERARERWREQERD